MAPKSLPPSAKQALVLSYLRDSLTAHTLKDLEKSLPSVASINGMQVKEYLQALSDDGKIHVEKIGSGNWYWSFASEETALRTSELAKLKAELEGATKAVSELEEKVAAARAQRADGEEEGEREMLITKEEVLSEEVKALRKELAGYADNDLEDVERKIKQVEGIKAKAERWTDNVMLVEGYMSKLLNGNTEGMDGLRRECYGTEYVEGEGLAEL
ncbi:hypothetical protein G7Y79_00028g062270 [Physcia stellaris]|nr:hypothetical protein G7Y79_00028g062270 [Physcia stellaris]